MTDDADLKTIIASLNNSEGELDFDRLLAFLMDKKGKLVIGKFVAVLALFKKEFQHEILMYLERLGIFEREERLVEEATIREFIQIRVEHKILEMKAEKAYEDNFLGKETPELLEEAKRIQGIVGKNPSKGRTMVEARIRTASWPIVVRNQSVLLQVCLPRHDQGDYQTWEVQNGESTVQLKAGSKPDKDNRIVSGKLPWGKFPRMLLFWINTQVNSKPENKNVFLGNSIGEFFDNAGLSRQGYTYDSFHDQLDRLLRCGLIIGYHYKDTGFPDAEIYPFSKEGSRTNYFLVSNQIDEFKGKDNQKGIRIMLSDSFYKSILENPLHIDMDSLKELGKSTFALDIFAMLAEALPRIEKDHEEIIERSYFEELFGGGRANKKKFYNETFLPALDLVLDKAYPDANIRKEKNRLILLPSPPASLPRLS